MGKYCRVEQVTNNMAHAHLTLRIPQTTHTHSEYVTLTEFHYNNGCTNASKCYVLRHINCVANYCIHELQVSELPLSQCCSTHSAWTASTGRCSRRPTHIGRSTDATRPPLTVTVVKRQTQLKDVLKFLQLSTPHSTHRTHRSFSESRTAPTDGPTAT